MTRITTHVLDTSAGRPAAGVAVTLEVSARSDWKRLASATTDQDGRVKNLWAEGGQHPAGTYRLVFRVGDYFAGRGIAGFYPYVEVVFTVQQGEHCHVPLLISPFGYSTYRGN